MIRFRTYLDKDAEQEWIMKMVEKGWAFKSFLAGFYQDDAAGMRDVLILKGFERSE